MNWAKIKKAINSNLNVSLDKLIHDTINTDPSIPLNELIRQVTASITETRFTTSGTYIVPQNINKIYISATGAGGKGDKGDAPTGAWGGDGGDGAWCLRKEFSVMPAQIINITVGTGNTIVSSTDFNLIAMAGSAAKRVTAGGHGSVGGDGGIETAYCFAGNGGKGGNGRNVETVINSYGGDGGAGGNGDFGGDGGKGGNNHPTSIYNGGTGGKGGNGSVTLGEVGGAPSGIVGGNGGKGGTGKNPFGRSRPPVFSYYGTGSAGTRGLEPSEPIQGIVIIETI